MVNAVINYVKRPEPGEQLYATTVESPCEQIATNIVLDPHEVEITDGRNYNFSLDKEGFQLLKHESRAVMYRGDKPLDLQHYFYECSNFVRRVTGANRAFVFNHVLRHNHSANNYGSILRAHVDQSDKSGPERVRDHFPRDAEKLLQKRVQMVTLWRPLIGPLFDDPLALLDASSMDEQLDLMPSNLILKHRVGENYAVAYNPNHKWYYFSAMQPNEVLLFKGYDSRKDVARFVPHSAFTLPNMSEGVVPRQSIEIRMLLFSK